MNVDGHLNADSVIRRFPLWLRNVAAGCDRIRLSHVFHPRAFTLLFIHSLRDSHGSLRQSLSLSIAGVALLVWPNRRTSRWMYRTTIYTGHRTTIYTGRRTTIHTSRSLKDVTLTLSSLYTLIVGVIIVVGIIGNCLTFVVFWKGNFKSSTSFLFLSLALINSVFLIAVFPIYSVEAFVKYTGCWLHGFYSVKPFLTVYGSFIVTTTKTATIWVTVLVAVNRYIIVCRPLRASQWCTISKVKIQLAVVLLLAVVCNIPILFKCRVKYYSSNNGTSYAIGVDWGVRHRWSTVGPQNVTFPKT